MHLRCLSAKACFLLCIYIGDGSILATFLVLKCPALLLFLGYLNFQGMWDLEGHKISQYRIFRPLSNGDNVEWL